MGVESAVAGGGGGQSFKDRVLSLLEERLRGGGEDRHRNHSGIASS